MKKLSLFIIAIILCAFICRAEHPEVNCACAYGDCTGICNLPHLKKDIMILRGPLEPQCSVLPGCSPFAVEIGKKEEEKSLRSEYRERRHNLITNGNFEQGLLSWWQYDINFGPPRFTWTLQTNSHLDHENHLPHPEGNFAAMTTKNRALGITKNIGEPHESIAFLGLYQDFNLDEFEKCDYVRLRLSFKYFIRNHAQKFVPGGIFQDGVQVFRVDILDGYFNEIWNAFITESGDNFEKHEHEYKTFKRKFYISNAINSNQYKSFRLRFAVFETLGKLTVGVDDVKLEAKCANFPKTHEEHYDEYHGKNGYQGGNQGGHHDDHHGNNGHHDEYNGKNGYQGGNQGGHHEEHHDEHHDEYNGKNGYQGGNQGGHHGEHHDEHHDEYKGKENYEEEKKRGKTIQPPKKV